MQASTNANFRLGDAVYDAVAGEIYVGAARARLEPRAAGVFLELAAARGEIVSRQALLDRCWPDDVGSDEALTQAVAQIRRALGLVGAQPAVETRAKRGYRLIVDFNQATPPPSGYAAPSRRGWLGFASALALIGAVLTIGLAGPHGPGHFIRHLVGWNGSSGHAR